MARRKQLTTRPLEAETLLQSMQREVIPYLRQTGSLVEQVAPSTPPVLIGAKGGNAALGNLIALLEAAGILKDSTTP